MSKKYFLEVVIRGHDALTNVLGKAARGVHRFGRGVKAAASSLWAHTKEAAKLAAGLGVVGYGAARAGSFLYDLAKGATDAGSAINDLNARTGINVETLQELAFVAGRGGASWDEFASGMDAVTKNMGQLAAGKGKLKGFVAAVAGPGFARALKAASPEERLELVLGGLVQIKDEAKRSAYATAFFGEAGAKMAVLANEGADGIARMRQEARDLGHVLSREDVAAMDEVGDALGDLETGVDGIKKKFGVELARAALPVLREAVTWIKQNRTQIGEWAKAFGAGVVDAAKGLKDAFVWIVDNAGVIAAGMAMALGPIGVAAAAIGGIVALLDRLDKMGRGDAERAALDAADKGIPGAVPLVQDLARSDVGRARRAELATDSGLAAGASAASFAQNTEIANRLNAVTADRARARALAQMGPAPWARGMGQQPGIKIEIDVKDPGNKVATPEVKKMPAGSQVVVKPPTGRRARDFFGQ